MACLPLINLAGYQELIFTFRKKIVAAIHDLCYCSFVDENLHEHNRHELAHGDDRKSGTS